MLPPDPQAAWPCVVRTCYDALVHQAEGGDREAGELVSTWTRRTRDLQAVYQQAGVAPWTVWDLPRLFGAVCAHEAGWLKADAPGLLTPAEATALRHPSTRKKVKALRARNAPAQDWRALLKEMMPHRREDEGVHGIVLMVWRGEGIYAQGSHRNWLRRLADRPARQRARQRPREDPVWGALIVQAVDRLRAAGVSQTRTYKLVHQAARLLLPVQPYLLSSTADWTAVRDLYRRRAPRATDRSPAP